MECVGTVCSFYLFRSGNELRLCRPNVGADQDGRDGVERQPGGGGGQRRRGRGQWRWSRDRNRVHCVRRPGRNTPRMMMDIIVACNTLLSYYSTLLEFDRETLVHFMFAVGTAHHTDTGSDYSTLLLRTMRTYGIVNGPKLEKRHMNIFSIYSLNRHFLDSLYYARHLGLSLPYMYHCTVRVLF